MLLLFSFTYIYNHYKFHKTLNKNYIQLSLTYNARTISRGIGSHGMSQQGGFLSNLYSYFRRNRFSWHVSVGWIPIKLILLFQEEQVSHDMSQQGGLSRRQAWGELHCNVMHLHYNYTLLSQNQHYITITSILETNCITLQLLYFILHITFYKFYYQKKHIYKILY